MSSYVAMKISRNDGTLAHALAKHEAGERVSRDIARMRTYREGYSGKRTMKGAFREMCAVFKEQAIHQIIEREKGSRAKGYLFVLEPLPTGDMVLFVVVWQKGHAQYRETPIIVSHHAVARVMQRTVGADNLSACIEVLRSYVLWAAKEAADLNRKFPEGMQLTVAGGGGALIFQPEGRDLVAKTWLAADMMADPKLKAAALNPNPTTWWEAV